jgi:hypothetical protein
VLFLTDVLVSDVESVIESSESSVYFVCFFGFSAVATFANVRTDNVDTFFKIQHLTCTHAGEHFEVSIDDDA